MPDSIRLDLTVSLHDMEIHTLDMFFLCRVKDTSHIAAMDDAADAFFVPLMEIHPEDFGLDSIRKGLDMFIHSNSPSYS